LDLTPDGKWLICPGENVADVAIWDAPAIVGAEIASFRWPRVVLPRRGLVLEPYGRRALNVVRLADGKRLTRLPFRSEAQVLPVASPDEELLATLESKTEIVVRRLVDFSMVSRLKIPPESSHSAFCEAQFSPDGQWLATGIVPGTVAAWNLASGECRSLLTLPSIHGGIARFSPKTGLLACTIFESDQIDLWNLNQNELVGRLQPQSAVRDILFLPDSTLAVGETRPVISVWDTSSFRQTAELHGHSRQLENLALSRDGRTLASTASDHTLRLWSISSHRLLFTLCQLDERLTWLAFQLNGDLTFTTAGNTLRWTFSGVTPATP